jgi:DNA polymerase III sliding clamp (beta) subunit (PCNA family)
MKFSCNVTGLIAGVKPVVEVATKNVPKDSDSAWKIMLFANKEEVLAQANNGRVAITNKISDLTIDDVFYKFQSSGKVTVKAIDLLNALESFRTSDTIIVETKELEGGTSEIVITRQDDAEEFISLPCLSIDVEMPKRDSSTPTTIEFDRDTFVYSINKVLFAIDGGEEKNALQYLSIITGKEKARFVAGTSQRFAIFDISGKDIISSGNNDTSILMPSGHVETVVKIFASRKDEKIKISRSPDSSMSPQFIFDIGPVEIIFVKINPDVKYPNLDKILSHDYSHKYVTSISDWEQVGRVISAAHNEDMKKERRAQKAYINVADNGQTILVKIDDAMKAAKKVAIISSSTTDSIAINCAGPFVKEIAANGPDDGNVQIELSKDPGHTPMIIRYYAQDKVMDGSELVYTNPSSGISEKFMLFWVTNV